MKTISCDVCNEIIIKNSRFITLLIKIDDNSSINNIIDNIKEKYPKATHYCYAYRLSDYSKSSDDGEPGGTAGIPMLNVLIKEDIINVLAVTIRYFGGIKLGAGGLVRAYTKSLTDAISISNMQELVLGYQVEITISYNEQKQLDYILKDIEIVSKEFGEKIIYNIFISDDNMSIIDNYTYSIVKRCLVKKVIYN